MATCLLAQATFLPDALNAKGVIPATVYVLAPVTSQPPNVSLQSCAYVLVDGVDAAALQQAVVPFDYTCEVVLITQDVSDVCSKIRVVIEKTFVMTKHTELGTDKHYRVDVYSRAKWTSRTAPLNSFQRSYNPEYFHLYKSHSTNEGDIQAKEVSIDKRGNIWSRPIIKFGVPLSFLIFASAFYFLWKFFHPATPAKLPDVAKSATGAPVASLPIAKAEPLVVDQWRVMGSFYVGESFVVALKGQGGVVRFLHSPPTFQLQGNDLSVQLPEGGFATTYSGNFDTTQRGFVK